MAFIFFVCIGATIGFALGWGFVSWKTGWALLLAVLILMVAAFLLEPAITGERQRSTAAVGLVFTSVGFGLAAAIGATIGMLAHWLGSRKR